MRQFAPPALSAALVPDAAGFLYIDRAKFHDAFCKDVPAADARVMAATQKPVNGSVFTASVPRRCVENDPVLVHRRVRGPGDQSGA